MHWKPTFCYKGHDQYKTNEKAFVYLNQIDDLKLRDIKPMMWFVCLLSTKWSLSCFGTLAKWPIFHLHFDENTHLSYLSPKFSLILSLSLSLSILTLYLCFELYIPYIILCQCACNKVQSRFIFNHRHHRHLSKSTIAYNSSIDDHDQVV